jgi:hypothetical protein
VAEQVQIRGLDEFRAGLRAAAVAEPQAAVKANTKIAKAVAAEAQMFAVGEGRQQAHFARFIVGRGSRTGASVGLRGRTANAAFWGAYRHTGWYSTKPGPPQFKPWIGNAWLVGVPGQGPYAINPAIAHESDNIIRSYSQMIDEITKKAFPT